LPFFFLPPGHQSWVFLKHPETPAATAKNDREKFPVQTKVAESFGGEAAISSFPLKSGQISRVAAHEILASKLTVQRGAG
jgi:hypothetical protein